MTTKPETKPGALALAYVERRESGMPTETKSRVVNGWHALADDVRALIARAESAEAEVARLLEALEAIPCRCSQGRLGDRIGRPCSRCAALEGGAK